MKNFKELDIFGTGIKWRLLQKDTFKSNFGASLTIILLLLFIYKAILFLEKVMSFGFAKKKSISEIDKEIEDILNDDNIKDNDKLYNQTIKKFDFNEMEFEINFDSFRENIRFPGERSEFNISNYLNIEIKYINGKKQNLTDFKYMKQFWSNNTYYFKMKKEYKDFDLLRGYVIDNLDKLKFEKKLRLAEVRLYWKSNLYDLMKNQHLSDIPIDICMKNYKLFEKDYTAQKIDKYFTFYLDLKKIYSGYFDLKKFSISKSFEFDTFNIPVSDLEKINYQENSYSEYYTLRNSELKGITFNETLFFDYNLYEDKNEVIILTLDDLLSVIGGYIQILMFIAQFMAGIYNEHLGNKLLNDYCFQRINKYDEILNEVKNNIKQKSKSLNEICSNNDKNLDNPFLINKSFKIDKENNERIQQKEKNFLPIQENDYKNRDQFLIKDEDKTLNNLFENEDNKNFAESSKRLNEDFTQLTDLSNINKKDQLSPKNIEIEMNNNKQESDEKYMKCNEISFFKNLKNKKKIEKTEKIKTNKKEFDLNPHDLLRNIFSRKKSGIPILKKLVVSYNRKKKKFVHFDFFEFINVDIYMNLLSGFEAFKYFFFDEINRYYFDKISNIYLYSENCQILSKNDETLDNQKELGLSKEFLQIEIFKRLNNILEKY